jgi:hypothetical protein
MTEIPIAVDLGQILYGALITKIETFDCALQTFSISTLQLSGCSSPLTAALVTPCTSDTS